MRAREFIINEIYPSLASVLKTATKVPATTTGQTIAPITSKPSTPQTTSPPEPPLTPDQINKMAKSGSLPKTSPDEKTKVDMSRLKPGQEIDFPGLGRIKVLRSTPAGLELDTSKVPNLQLPKITIDPTKNL